MQKKILVVDDEPNNLEIMRHVLRDKYKLLFAKNGDIALEAAMKHQPDLILLDIMMPGTSGYDVCERLKANQLTQHIPVIFVTAMSEVDDESRGFDVGAVDFINKPVSAPILLRRIQIHLSLVQKGELEKQASETIYMLGKAGHYNDTDTGVHIWRMAAYSRLLAEKAGWDIDLAKLLGQAAPMHDTGKIGIPDEILKAPRKLTPDEWEIMKQHTTIGFEILREGSTPVMKIAAEIALSHHERWDGSGYPLGMSGSAIPQSARIVSIADVFDALTMKRPYKKAWTVDEALDHIHDGAGGQFDPELAELFIASRKEVTAVMDEWSLRE